MLHPQDLLVALRLSLSPQGKRATFQELSMELGMSPSQVHASVARARESALLVKSADGDRVNHLNLEEFVIHGVKYAFPARRGGLVRGIPTSYAVPPLLKHFPSGDMPPVWPHPEGTVRGESLSPLYRSAPAAALKNPQLYELLALTDAIRAGRARERALASQELSRRFRR